MPANVRTKYETNAGAIHPIVLKPDTASAAGTPPAGAVTQSIKAKVSKSTRAYGLRPRGLTLSRTLGTAPDTFTKTTFLPVLTEANFNAAAAAIGATILVGTTSWTVVAKRPEDFN